MFLKKVLPGKADKSYGIHVAGLAGVPETVLQRAKEVLNQLENRPSKASASLVFEQPALFAVKTRCSQSCSGLMWTASARVKP